MYRLLMKDGELIVLEDLAQFIGILLNLSTSHGPIRLHAMVDPEGVLVIIDPDTLPPPTSLGSTVPDKGV